MTKPLTNNSTNIQELSSNLLSTLDESVFFSQLSGHLLDVIKSDKILIFRVLDDFSAKLVSKNCEPVQNGTVIKKGAGAAGHVIRTKKPYFSNNVERDPMFVRDEMDQVKAELCVPVIHEGIVIATIHFQIQGEEQFTRDDITEVFSVLGELTAPIANMKMYLSAKSLNEVLLKKIEEKEKELEERSRGLKFADSFKIQEKDIVGKSDAMKNLLVLTDKVAPTDVNCLIEGPSGSGKEMIARRIHCRSNRASGPFVVVDCSAMQEGQLDSEIFGVERNDYSFVGRIKNGLLEAANGGTLVLHKITSMPISVQVKLLYFLKEGMCFRVGGQTPYRADVRIITTSTGSLEDDVAAGTFRADLLCHLNTMILEVPSLTDRKKDIELLANYFLNHDRSASEQKSFSPGAVKALTDYSWPNNVRELQNVVERAYILADGVIVERTHLADCITKAEIQEEVEEEAFSFTEMTLNELERKHICMTLDHLGGNKTKTAKVLGITVKTLYNKLHSYGMIDSKEA